MVKRIGSKAGVILEARDEEVQFTIVIIVSPRGARRESINAHLRRTGNPLKRAISPVMIEEVVGTVIPVADKKIDEPVVVIISPGAAKPVTAAADNRTGSDFRERGIDFQKRHLAGHGAGGIGQDHSVVAGVGELRIGNSQAAVGCVYQFQAVEAPLVTERQSS